jgi:chemotaxis protein MotB
MGTTNLGQGLLEPSGIGHRTAASHRQAATAGSATPWVLLVFALAAGGYFSYDFLGRAQNARAAADRAEAELKLTRQRAFEAEQKQADLTGQLAVAKAESDRVPGNAGAADDARKKPAAAPEGKPDALAAELTKSLGGAEAELNAAPGRLAVDVADRALFRGAKAELTTNGKKLLRQLGEVLNRYPDRAVWVIGQGDGGPAKGAELAQAWELSSARALAVVHYLVDEVKVDPRRLTAAGSGPARAAPRSKARHRRVSMWVLPADAAAKP